MKIKKIELNNFKRFTHLIVEDIPETTKLVVLVGPNGSGKTSFMESMNHYYKYAGYGNIGDYHYLSKTGNTEDFNHSQWYERASKIVSIDFHDASLPKDIGSSNDRQTRPSWNIREWIMSRRALSFSYKKFTIINSCDKLMTYM